MAAFAHARTICVLKVLPGLKNKAKDSAQTFPHASESAKNFRKVTYEHNSEQV